jgi:hypothetical protein
MVGHVVLSADRPASTSGCCVETAPAGVEAGAGAVPTVGDRGSGWLESGPAGTGDNSSTLVSAAGLEPVTAVVLVGYPAWRLLLGSGQGCRDRDQYRREAECDGDPQRGWQAFGIAGCSLVPTLERSQPGGQHESKPPKRQCPGNDAHRENSPQRRFGGGNELELPAVDWNRARRSAPHSNHAGRNHSDADGAEHSRQPPGSAEGVANAHDALTEVSRGVASPWESTVARPPRPEPPGRRVSD